MRSNMRKNQKHTELSREKMSQSREGKKMTKETRLKMSISASGRPGWNKGLKGFKTSGSFKNGMKPWSYIDGRSKGQCWDRYGPDWRRIRQLVLIRDNFTCRNPNCPYCSNLMGIKRLEVHHKIPFLLSRDNSLENLITYCPKFHKIEEARIMRELKKQESK